ncbi:MAG: CheR family methyltransferase [Deltaproteobacteria bacterium]
MFTITDQEFDLLTSFLRNHFGINLPKTKRYLVIARLQSVLQEKGMNDFTSFLQYLASDTSGQALQTLLSRLTTNHTYFMREDTHFEYIKTTVLPELVKILPDKDLRIWSAGCSSGQEPYTLAMVIADYFGAQKGAWDTRILATDISPRVLEQAKAGIYDKEDLEHLSDSWHLRYFKPADNDRREVAPNIKDEVIFRCYNLMNQPFPFKKKFHMIFCRNVMIYFDSSTRKKLIKAFYDVTADGGYFFVGLSESLNRQDIPYRYIRPSVYQKG